MADNSTPAAAAAPAAAAPGTGTGAAAPAAAAPAAPAPAAGGGDPKVPTDPAEAAKYWQGRHEEATATITRTTQKLGKYKDTYGELDDEPPAPKPAADGSTVPPNVWTDEKQKDWELSQQIGRTPTLVPHAQEIKDLVKGGLKLDEARETVAKRHNITLGPSVGSLDMMPTLPAGGGNAAPVTGFSNEQLEAMRADGIDPEKAKKHAGKVQEILKRARRG